MPADEKVQRVMTRIGVWTPGKCPEYAAFGRYPASCSHGVPWGDHDIPCPDPADPAIIVKMIEWQTREFEVPMFDEESRTTVFVPDQHHAEIWFGEDNLWHARIDHWAETGVAPTLHAALTDAIDALPED